MPVLTDESNELGWTRLGTSRGFHREQRRHHRFRGNSLDQIQTELSCPILSRQPTETAYQRRERLLPR
jgi:hypothetical protein